MSTIVAAELWHNSSYDQEVNLQDFHFRRSLRRTVPVLDHLYPSKSIYGQVWSVYLVSALHLVYPVPLQSWLHYGYPVGSNDINISVIIRGRETSGDQSQKQFDKDINDPRVNWQWWERKGKKYNFEEGAWHIKLHGYTAATNGCSEKR